MTGPEDSAHPAGAAALPVAWRLLAAVRGVGPPLGLVLLLGGLIAIVVLSWFDGPTRALTPLVLLGVALLIVGLLLNMLSLTPSAATVTLASPVRGRWSCLNSPSSKVPSHGTHGLGQAFAIDMVAEPADESRPRFGSGGQWRPPTDYPAFGAPILAPATGRVVAVHDARRDHLARSGWLSLGYLLVEGMVREVGGLRWMLGNHVIIDAGATFVTLAHLQRGSVTVAVGDQVAAGDVLGACGNSGNSSEPHLHLQVTDTPRLRIASGFPMRLTDTHDDDGAALSTLPENQQVFSSAPAGQNGSA